MDEAEDLAGAVSVPTAPTRSFSNGSNVSVEERSVTAEQAKLIAELEERLKFYRKSPSDAEDDYNSVRFRDPPKDGSRQLVVHPHLNRFGDIWALILTVLWMTCPGYSTSMRLLLESWERQSTSTLRPCVQR